MQLASVPKLLTCSAFNVTEHPSAEWTAQQMVDAFPWDTAPRYLVRGCLRYLLLVMCAHPFAKEALTLHLARSEVTSSILAVI